MVVSFCCQNVVDLRMCIWHFVCDCVVAALPVQWLSQYTLGVTALQPGHETWVAAPFVSENLRRVAGRVPTISGPVDVEATWQPGAVTVVVTAATPGRIGVLRTHTATAGGTLIGITVDGTEQQLLDSVQALDGTMDHHALFTALGESQVAERWFTVSPGIPVRNWSCRSNRNFYCSVRP